MRSARSSASANRPSLSAVNVGTPKLCVSRASSGAPAPSSPKAISTTGTRRRFAVSSSEAAPTSPAAAVKATTRRSPWTRWAAMAAGRAKPVAAEPSETINSPGATASHPAATSSA